MPIFFIVGKPRSGKSYESVANHILPAVKNGRKVLTNIPLNLTAFARLDPSYKDLIEIKGEVPGWGKPFSLLDDYHDDWRHTDGFGVLIVIDECHEVLPLKTPEEIRHWFARHGHQNVDVILITQDYRKVSLDIRKMAEKVIAVRKNTNFGSPNQYRYAEFDDVGMKGKPIFSTKKKYDPQYFPLYTSFTAIGGSPGVEIGTGKARPQWMRWQFLTVAVMVVAYGAFLLSRSLGGSGNPVGGSNLAKPASAAVAKPVAGNAVELADDGRPAVLYHFGDVAIVRAAGQKQRLRSTDIVGADECGLSYRSASPSLESRLADRVVILAKKKGRTCD